MLIEIAPNLSLITDLVKFAQQLAACFGNLDSQYWQPQLEICRLLISEGASLEESDRFG